MAEEPEGAARLTFRGAPTCPSELNGNGRTMSGVFALGTAIFWTIAYILIIRAGLREQTFGMPIVAFAMNISWEFCFAFIRPTAGIQQWVNVIWFALDCAVGYTVVRYGPREFPFLGRRLFYPALLGLLALAYVGMNEASLQFDGGRSSITGFGDNLAMSGLFLALFAARGGDRGQSVGIAAAKLLGTACASLTLLTSTYHQNPQDKTPLIHYMYFTCLVLDLAYVAALVLYRRTRRPSLLDSELGAGRGMERQWT